VYTAEIMLRFGAFYDVGAGVRSLLPLAGLAAGGYLLLRALTARYDAPPLHVDPQRARRVLLGPWRWPAALLVALPLLLATVAPVLALAMSTSLAHAPALSDYAVAWEAAHMQILNTALYGPLAATLALVMAWPLARAVARGPARTGSSIQTVSLGQLAVPGVALGMGLIRLWNRAGPLGWVYGSPLMVIMAGALRGLPLAALALSVAWRQLPVEVEEAALIAGASASALRRRVLAPLLRPGIAAAWGLACYRAMTDLEATVLVHAPGDDTLAVRIYTLQHDGQAEHVAALALTLVALTLVAALSVRVLWRVGSDL
jgi:iron(III) transport system permease protein